ncbi:MAG: RNA polymerase sigma factor [Aquaticitalea sp.]
MQKVSNDHISCEDLRHGSDRLFEQIYEENRAHFVNFAKRYNLPYDDVIDVYQDAYITFYNNVMNGKLQTLTSSISTYLFSIGKYMIYEKLKKNKKKVSADYNLERVRSDDEVMSTIEIEDEPLSVEQELLAKYFNTLGKQCQRLLTLFYYRGYNIKDIMKAENYNTENVVKSQKSRCMKTLKDKIKADQLNS